MSEQVDLSTIPISPNGENGGPSAGEDAADASENVTVFHDKDNFNVKHPLANRWTLWFTKPSSGKVCDRMSQGFDTLLLRKTPPFTGLPFANQLLLGRQLE